MAHTSVSTFCLDVYLPDVQHPRPYVVYDVADLNSHRVVGLEAVSLPILRRLLLEDAAVQDEDQLWCTEGEFYLEQSRQLRGAIGHACVNGQWSLSLLVVQPRKLDGCSTMSGSPSPPSPPRMLSRDVVGEAVQYPPLRTPIPFSPWKSAPSETVVGEVVTTVSTGGAAMCRSTGAPLPGREAGPRLSDVGAVGEGRASGRCTWLGTTLREAQTSQARDADVSLDKFS